MRTVSVLLVVALLGLGTTARAQSFAVDRGSWLVGGAAGFNSMGYSGQSGRATLIFLYPEAQYFVAPGLALGGTLTLARQDLGGGVHQFGYGAGPAATYYFGRAHRSVYPYVGARASLVRSRVTGGSADSQSQVGARAGLLFMLARNVGVDAGLYYDRYRGSGSPFNDYDFYGLQIGVAAFVF